MTAPGNFVFIPNGIAGGLTATSGQAIVGSQTLVGDGSLPAVTNLLVPGATVQETPITPLVADSLLRGMAVGQPILTWPEAPAGVAEVIPYARMTSTGPVLCTGNLTALAATFGPASLEAAGFKGLMRHQLVNSGAGAFGSVDVATFPSPGAVANRQALETGVGAFVNTNSIAIINPAAALPAGFMLAYTFTAGFFVGASLANLTAAPADPGAIDFNVGVIWFDNSAGTPGSATGVIPQGQNGPFAVNVLSGLTASFGVIAAATVGEAVISGLGADIVAPGDLVHVCPRLAMPEAMMAPSHARVTAAGSFAWGIANLDPAVATAAHDVVCDVAIFRGFPVV